MVSPDRIARVDGQTLNDNRVPGDSRTVLIVFPRLPVADDCVVGLDLVLRVAAVRVPGKIGVFTSQSTDAAAFTNGTPLGPYVTGQAMASSFAVVPGDTVVRADVRSMWEARDYVTADGGWVLALLPDDVSRADVSFRSIESGHAAALEWKSTCPPS
jgi:hypothetical protein